MASEMDTTETVTVEVNTPPKSALKKHGCNGILYSLGAFFLIAGVVGTVVFPSIVKVLVVKNLVLEEGKDTFEKWRRTPVPVTFKVYIWNVTNPKEVMQGAQPIVDDVGPFTFKQLRSKDVLSWSEDMLTVTYDDKKQYHFVKELSADIESKVYSLNLPLQGILMTIKKVSSFARPVVDNILEGILKNYEESLFSHRTPRELLFEGYKVDLIQDLTDLASAFVTIPQILPNNTFGFLYGKNNSGDGMFSVFTGKDDITKYTQIVTFNNMSRIKHWGNEYCNMMNGTDGSQFPPPVTRKDVLYVYTPDLCRSISLEWEADVAVKGIPALRFNTPSRLFASPKQNPDNQCYCTDQRFCYLSGILDISPCRNGMKLAATGPHFYQAHKFIQERVAGLHPNKEDHGTYVDIEPNTGFVLRASRKLQMNFILEPFDGLEETRNVEMAVIPLIWVVEEAEISEEVSAMFTAKLRTPVTVAKSVLTACIVLGVLWILTAGIATLYILVKEQQTAKAIIKSKYKAVPQRAADDNITKTDKLLNKPV